MRRQGEWSFFLYGEGLFLSGEIGPEYLQLPPAPKKPEAKPAPVEKPLSAPPTPGSVWLDIQGQPTKPWKEKGRKKNPAGKKGRKSSDGEKRGKTKAESEKEK